MSWLSKLFEDTLKPTERELLEADAAWWKDSAKHWRQAFDAVARERDGLRSGLADIYAHGNNSKSGTARAMGRKAWKALK